MSGVLVDKALYERYHEARNRLREHRADNALARDVMRMHVALFYEPQPVGVELKDVAHPLYPKVDSDYATEPGVAASIRRRRAMMSAHIERGREASETTYAA